MRAHPRRATSLLPSLPFLVALASCATVAPPAAAPPAPATVSAAVQPAAAAASRAIAAAMAADSIPAMSVAVVRDGELVWSQAFGTANLETGDPARPETRFRLGSVAKLFTADTTALLAADGVVDLDADIREILPAFPDKGTPITLRQLLGHLGGIRHYRPEDFDPAQPGGSIDLRLYPDAASILAIFADDPLVAVPGEKLSYSTFGYSLAGLVLEAATGRSTFDLIRERILAPAGISGIAVDDWFAIVPGRARNYDPTADLARVLAQEDYGPVVNSSPLNSAYKVPGGGLTGTAEAVARFGALHFAPGFLPAPVYAEIFRVQHTNSGEPTPVGLGWWVGRDAAGRRTFAHSGSQQGCRADLLVYPDDRVAVALLSNLGNRPADVRAVSSAVAAGFLPAAPVPPPDHDPPSPPPSR